MSEKWMCSKHGVVEAAITKSGLKTCPVCQAERRGIRTINKVVQMEAV